MKIKSDPALISEVRSYGQFNTNACYQCGSCTVTCNLTNGHTTFPRKAIRYVLTGLKAPLHSSLEPWLCYYCGDCSTHCPRETEPGEAMMTLRRYLTAQYDWTGLSSRLYRSSLWEVATLAMVGLLMVALIVFYHLKIAGLELSDFWTTAMGLEHMFDKIVYFTRIVFLVPLVVLILNAYRMFRLVMCNEQISRVPVKLYVTEIKTFFVHLFTQKQFKECEENRRWLLHGLLVAGCVMMVFIKFFFLEWFQTDEIYSILDPQRWLGYIAAIALIIGCTDILIGRMRKQEQAHKFTDASDWILPVLLLLTALSGITIHLLRQAGQPLAALYAYAFHVMVVVPMFIVEIPFGKWSHVIYRPLASYFQSIQDKAVQNQTAAEEVVDHVK